MHIYKHHHPHLLSHVHFQRSLISRTDTSHMKSHGFDENQSCEADAPEKSTNRTTLTTHGTYHLSPLSELKINYFTFRNHNVKPKSKEFKGIAANQYISQSIDLEAPEQVIPSTDVTLLTIELLGKQQYRTCVGVGVGLGGEMV